jgi:hypothetical protein
MAQDLVIKGVTYSGVSKVDIPTADGGVASFVEATSAVKAFSVNSITTTSSDSTNRDTSTYHGSYWAAIDGNGNLLLVVEGGTSTNYESIYFVMASLPDGMELVNQSYYNGTSMTAGMAYVAVISGVTSDIDIALDFSDVNGTYDRVQCDVTITAI